MEFAKLQGSGNDFVLIDNRDRRVDRFIEARSLSVEEFVRRLCEPHRSVSADGVILVEEPRDPENDFRWRFFNADGSTAEMCGNGARCAVRFCYDLGIVNEEVRFETLAGVIRAEVLESGRRVRVQLTRPTPPQEKTLRLEEREVKGFYLNTGVPHFVVVVEDVGGVDVRGLGRRIRYHEEFRPAGTNVNFIARVDEGTIAIRTYERGVESETLACGTGATASAIVSYRLGLVTRKPVNVLTKSGEILRVDFSDDLSEVLLEGSVYKVFEGFLSDEIFLTGHPSP